jgi:hypothetical protein
LSYVRIIRSNRRRQAAPQHFFDDAERVDLRSRAGMAIPALLGCRDGNATRTAWRTYGVPKKAKAPATGLLHAGNSGRFRFKACRHGQSMP